jgi:hypothetical protein
MINQLAEKERNGNNEACFSRHGAAPREESACARKQKDLYDVAG